jgi:uncharacterized protein YyaL (SSP411 family)
MEKVEAFQHACNPVDWHPWRKEFFEKPGPDDKPTFQK